MRERRLRIQTRRETDKETMERSVIRCNCNHYKVCRLHCRTRSDKVISNITSERKLAAVLYQSTNWIKFFTKYLKIDRLNIAVILFSANIVSNKESAMITSSQLGVL